MSNSKLYPEAWKIFVRDARNIEKTEEGKQLGKYTIHSPIKSEWLYSDTPDGLFRKFKDEFYKPDIKSPSVYGKIQYIVTNF